MNLPNINRRVFIKKTSVAAIATVIAAEVLRADTWVNGIYTGSAGWCDFGVMSVADNNPLCAQAQNPNGNPPTQLYPCVVVEPQPGAGVGDLDGCAAYWNDDGSTTYNVGGNNVTVQHGGPYTHNDGPISVPGTGDRRVLW